MVRRFYIAGGNNLGDPAVNTRIITDDFFTGDNEVHSVFKEGFRPLQPITEWSVDGNTVTVIAGPTFDLNEVIVIDVVPKKKGVTCADSYQVDPYLPDIIKCIVARVNSKFENDEDDPFSVYYGKGLYEQVGKDRFLTQEGYLMVWLVMPFEETPPPDNSYFADAVCKILVATITDANYTQDQREEINFHPRLIPVYKELIEQIKADKNLNNSITVEHKRRLLPYWGGGDVNGPGQKNLWQAYVDCIEISNLKLKIGHINYCVFTSNF